MKKYLIVLGILFSIYSFAQLVQPPGSGGSGGGNVNVTNSSLVVSPLGGTTFPVSISGTVPVSFSAASSQVVTGTVTTIPAGGSTWPVSGTFFQVTQPISAASLPTHPITYAGGSTLPVQLLQFGASTLTGLGQALSSQSIPVVLASDTTPIDLYITGNAAQVVLQNNLLQGASTIALDATGYRSASTQIVSTGTAGGLIFEGSNDNINFQSIPVWSQLVLTGTPIIAAITPSVSQLIYTYPLPMRYIRLRISTQVTGGVVQAFSKFSQTSFAPGIQQVAQATAGNFNVTLGSGTVTTLTTLANGQTAHSSASTGSPLRVGGRVNTTTDATLVQGDASDLFMSSAGQLVQKPYASAELDWSATSGLTPLAVTTLTQLKAAGAAGVKNHITGCQFLNSSATVNTTVSLLDGSSVLWVSFLPATTAALPEVPVNVDFSIPLHGSNAAAMNIQLGTIASSVYYNCQGYQAP